MWALLGTLLTQGCEPSSRDIATWKRTEKGPGKLRSALSDTGLSLALRVEAAMALCDIHRGDEVEEAISRMPEAARQALVSRLVTGLAALLGDAGGDGRGQPGRSEIEAKDCLFRLRALGDAGARARAEEALTRWTTHDLPGRMSAGSYGSETILLDMPARAQGALLDILRRAERGSAEVLPAAALLGRVGDASHKAQGAAALLRLLPPVPTEADQPMLRALGSLGGEAGRGYLARIIDDRSLTPSLRKLAWLAVREGGDPALLPLALRIAWDPREAAGVREAAFAYLEKAGQIAVEGLLKIVRDPRDPGKTGEIVRFRAFEAALAAGGAQAVVSALEALPTQPSYRREDLVAYVVHQVTPLGQEARAPLKQALRSPSWVARVAAIIALSELGRTEDEADLLALSDDATRLRGEGFAASTVGALAREHAGRLGKIDKR